MVERIEGASGAAATVAEVAQGVWRAQLAGSGASVDFSSRAAARLWAALASGRAATYGEARAVSAAR